MIPVTLACWCRTVNIQKICIFANPNNTSCCRTYQRFVSHPNNINWSIYWNATVILPTLYARLEYIIRKIVPIFEWFYHAVIPGKYRYVTQLYTRTSIDKRACTYKQRSGCCEEFPISVVNIDQTPTIHQFRKISLSHEESHFVFSLRKSYYEYKLKSLQVKIWREVLEKRR